ncbi:MAG: penicillin-binding protein activator LpoB [Spirochaetaceae bacterium]|nr:penicillin-binding protein activator LpoB [Spirochaetaceae bacterium]
MLRKSLCFCVICCALLASCASSGVKRLDTETQLDLGGYWNETDVKLISETLVTECVNAQAIKNYLLQHKRQPTVILGKFRNLSDEHLDTSILAKKFEIALVNSGRVSFVASSSDRDLVRLERDDQQYNASEDTAKSLGNETGADFMLFGSVKTIVDQAKGKTLRSYIVNAELVDIETNQKVWVGENSEIRKLITRSSVRW